MNGKKIKHILIDKEVSQKDFAEAVGVSQAFISYVIKGYKDPSVAVLKRMADYLNLPIDELV